MTAACTPAAATAAPGTLDNPATHDPMLRHRPKQEPAMTPTHPFRTAPSARAEAPASRQNRTREMQLMPETLARAHIQARLYEAESERRGRRLLAARRLTRRAERATLRARRALAMAVMQ